MKKMCKTDKKKSEQKKKKFYTYACKCGFMSNNKNKLCKPKKL